MNSWIIFERCDSLLIYRNHISCQGSLFMHIMSHENNYACVLCTDYIVCILHSYLLLLITIAFFKHRIWHRNWSVATQAIWIIFWNLWLNFLPRLLLSSYTQAHGPRTHCYLLLAGRSWRPTRGRGSIFLMPWRPGEATKMEKLSFWNFQKFTFFWPIFSKFEVRRKVFRRLEASRFEHK